jgi:hypothetical protein
MSSRPKSIQAIFGENDLVAPLLAQHKRLSRLQQSFADPLPPGWNSLCRVAALEGTTVVIAAANGAIATNLKAYSPKLLENFRSALTKNQKKIKQEQELTGIRIMVQPEISTWRPPTATAVKLAAQKTPMSAQQLADLADNLTDSPLKVAVTRIQSKLQSKQKRDKSQS